MSINWEHAFDLRKSGKTFKEIAELVGASEGYVRKQLSGVAKGEESVSQELRLALKRLSKELSEISGKL